jgi:D-cysteine desulfhydrase family pyridoxal phosphate-dependent enzyme
MLDDVQRIPLAQLPTPLEEAPRLARSLGLRRLLIKRDDQTGLALGGNKARKLEYDFAEAVRRGCDVVLTAGGAQSNHARMTAAAARKLGMDVKIVLGGGGAPVVQGNMLLDAVMGAEIRYLKDTDANDALTSAMEEWTRELREAGRNPFPIPIGGSTGLGALGYVRAMKELAGEIGGGPFQIVLAVGSCGTLAGAILGARLYLPGARLTGISVSRTTQAIRMETERLIHESEDLIGTPHRGVSDDYDVRDCYHEEYGLLTRSGREAILTCARLEGLLLDPIYTGKSMAGLMDLARTGVLDPALPVVFIHTGGLPILFAFDRELSADLRCTLL